MTGVWRSEKEAKAVRTMPRHVNAKREGFKMYYNICIKVFELQIQAGLEDCKVVWKKDYFEHTGKVPSPG